ncbi:hypothetical protein FRC06_006932 [Ceratobasidium sp. 370]|nr:hypothetical protein FRC06_006932 [Ceratobasidium sp. 370]
MSAFLTSHSSLTHLTLHSHAMGLRLPARALPNLTHLACAAPALAHIPSRKLAHVTLLDAPFIPLLGTAYISALSEAGAGDKSDDENGEGVRSVELRLGQVVDVLESLTPTLMGFTELHTLDFECNSEFGRATACAAAGRLAAANPDLELLLIEQGPDNLNEPTVFTPALVLAHLAPESKSTLFRQGNKGDKVNGRGPIYPFTPVESEMALTPAQTSRYARPSASDFDDWNTPGWKAKDLIPLLQKEYLDVIVRRGVPLVEDLMDNRARLPTVGKIYSSNGMCNLLSVIPNTDLSEKTCHRQDAAHCYIHPQANNKSLRILTKTKVVRVVSDGTKATGVEVVANKAQIPGADPTPRTITARKLVVMSAGTIASPILLQRSSVGCAERLSRLGIRVVSNLPDVGRHYEDHSSLIATFHVADDTETMDCIVDKTPGFMERYLPEFAEGRGFLTTNANDAGSKLRPTPEELKEMGPAFQEVWKRHYERALDKPALIQRVFNGYLGPRSTVPDGKRFMMIGNIQGYPVSRGHVYITSPDPYAPPDFETGFLNEQADVDVLVWAYKQCREVVRRMPSFRGEYAGLHPKFPNGSAATCVRLSGPPPTEMEDIIYAAEDNAAIEEFVRETANTTWHSIGTIPMKPKEQGGCVDARLNVYGTTGLKVADLSILPSNVGANTNSTALLFGEKAAILIAEDLGLSLP